jgi:hypothetical protein
MADGRHLVCEREEDIRTHFTMTPNIVLRMGLKPQEVVLYMWYKMVCGESDGGKCWQSLKGITKALGMAKATAIAARDELASKGLIIIDKTGVNGSKRVTVRIVNIWKENNQFHKTNPPLDEFYIKPGGFNQNPNKITYNKMDSFSKEKLSPPAKRDGEGDTTQKGFISNTTSRNPRSKKKTPRPKEAGKQAAGLLAHAIQRIGKPYGRRNAALKWPREFADFFEEDPTQIEYCLDLLEWYADHLDHDRHVPQGLSPKTFVEKITSIALARDRINGVHEDTNKNNGDVKIARQCLNGWDDFWIDQGYKDGLPTTQENINERLSDLGHKPNRITEHLVDAVMRGDYDE